MTLEKQIEILKEWHKRAGTEMYLPIMSSEDIDRFLHWLEDYKQLKSDYIELDNRLRTANTEIDRLKSVSSWIPCSERMPDDNVGVLVYDDVILIASYNSDEKYTSGWMEKFECYPLPNVTHWMPLPEVPQRKDDTHDYD